jgi:hypothetical protein
MMESDGWFSCGLWYTLTAALLLFDALLGLGCMRKVLAIGKTVEMFRGVENCSAAVLWFHLTYLDINTNHKCCCSGQQTGLFSSSFLSTFFMSYNVVQKIQLVSYSSARSIRR